MPSTLVAAALPLIALLAGCATASGSGVPSVHPERLYALQFAGLEPRTIALEVVDERVPLPESSAEMVAEVTRALSVNLRGAGLTTDPKAGHALRIRVSYKDAPLADYDREDCIWFHSKLATANGSTVQSEGGACFEWRNIYGMDLGGDASTAFESGLSGMLEQLDRGWASLPKPAEGRPTKG